MTFLRKSATCLIILACFCGAALAELRILPLGDSITRGEGAAASLVPGGYRDPLARALTDADISFRFVGDWSSNPTDYLAENGQDQHSGHGGWRIDQIHNSITNWQLSFEPDAVLLHIGTNDILQNANLGNGADFDTSGAISRLTTLLDTLYANNDALTVVLSTLIPIQDDRDGYVKNYNAALASTVVPHFSGQGRSIKLVDNYAAFVTENGAYRNERFDDGVHPNAAGYRAMADVWFPAVEDIPVPPDRPEPPPPPETLRSTSEIEAGMAGFDDRILTNLVRSGEPTLGSMVTSHGPSMPATFKTSGLNDGSAAASANITYYAVSNPEGNLPTTITFTLAGSTTGYDVTRIESIAGWQDSNIGNQKFRLQLALNGGDYQNYGTYSALSELGDFSSLVTVTDESGVIASGVTGIRFVFLNPEASQGGHGGTVIRELQVFGSPTSSDSSLRSTSEIESGMASFDDRIRTNLVQNGQSTLGSVEVGHEPSMPATFKTAGLNDGSAAASANITYYATNGSEGNLPTTITFTLAGSATGYDITRVESIAGWQDSNIGDQKFRLQLAENGGGFLDYGTYSAISELGGFSSLVTVTDESGVIASGVTAVRFVFLNPEANQGGNGGTVIRELQVFGAPSEAGPQDPDLGEVVFTFSPGAESSAELSVPVTSPGSYVFQRSGDLDQWEDLETRVVGQEDVGLLEFADEDPPAGRAFYRVVTR